MTFPFSWKGKLIQYLGRVARPYPNKQKAFVYDYFDAGVPVLKVMYYKRLRTYRELGLIKTKPKSRHHSATAQAGLFDLV